MSPSLKLSDLAVHRQAAGPAVDQPRQRHGQPPAGAARPGLDKGRFTQPPPSQDREGAGWVLKNRSGRGFFLADRLQAALWRRQYDDGIPAGRIARCGRPLAGAVELVRDGGRVYADGLIRCGSARCPVCARAVAQVRYDHMRNLFAGAEKAGMQVGLVTLTARHGPDDRLADLREDLAGALAKVRRGSPWKRLVSKSKTAGSVRWWEATWGAATGWHLHCHMLVFVHKDGCLKTVAEGIIERWQRFAGQSGRLAMIEGQDWKPVTVGGGEGSADGIKQYATGDTTAGIRWEVAGEWMKQGRRPERASLGELAALAAVDDKQACLKWMEAVDALHGMKGLTTDKALTSLFRVDDLNEDDLPEEADLLEDSGEADGKAPEPTGLIVPTDIWRELERRKRRGHALGAAADAWDYASDAIEALTGMAMPGSAAHAAGKAGGGADAPPPARGLQGAAGAAPADHRHRAQGQPQGVQGAGEAAPGGFQG